MQINYSILNNRKLSEESFNNLNLVNIKILGPWYVTRVVLIEKGKKIKGTAVKFDTKWFRYLSYLFKVILSSISYIIAKHKTFRTSTTMSHHHLHFQVAKGCITLIYCVFTRIEHRYCSFLEKRQKTLRRHLTKCIFLWAEIIPCHQVGAEKMHANQIEEKGELILCAQLHVQPRASFFQKKPITWIY